MRSATLLCLWLLVGSVAPAGGQVSRFTGVTLERFHAGDARLTTVAIRHTALGRNGLGVDIAGGLAPGHLPADLMLELDAGLAQRVRVAPATLVLKAGMGSFLAGRGLKFYPGALAGVALLLPLQQRCEIRLDVARRHYWPEGEAPVAMWSIGLGLAVRARHDVD